MGTVVAIDIGGTTIKSSVVTVPDRLSATRLTGVRRTPTPKGDPTGRALLDAVARIVRSYGSDVDGVGVVIPGVLDVPGGKVRAAGNLQLFDVPIVAPLEAELGMSVNFEHDVRAGAIGELYAGAGIGLRDAAFLPIGTGIAAAFIIDGEVRSADGYMGEIGHAHVGPDDPCVCGRFGCLETIASAAAIARRYREASGDDKASAPAVIARAAEGDPHAQRVWNEALDGLGLACAWIANLLGSEAIILGGGLSRAGAALFAPLTARVTNSLGFQRVPRLIPATHGDDAGCLGAAILALRGKGIA